MSSVVLTGDTSGSVTLTVPLVAGSNTATLAAATGTHFPFSAGTAVNSTSGTSIDFTSIPSWVKRITVMFSGVSTNGTSSPLIQIGSGSVTTSGYLSSSSTLTNAVTSQQSTAGFIITGAGVISATTLSGQITLTLITGNTWVYGSSIGITNNAGTIVSGGNLTLGGALDRVRITTVNGTDTFDAGSINILFE